MATVKNISITHIDNAIIFWHNRCEDKIDFPDLRKTKNKFTIKAEAL